MIKKTVKYIIVTDRPKLFNESDDRIIVTPHQFINDYDEDRFSRKNIRVINLSGDYDYLSRGYYVSLLSEARDLQSIPKVSGIVSLNWRRHYAFALPEINELLESSFNVPYEEPLTRTYTSFFGRHADKKIEPVARKIFDIFRFPIVTFDIKYTNKGKWNINNIATPSFNSLIDEQHKVFIQDLEQFTGSAWRASDRKPNQERYWIAMLHNPNEKNPPSDMAALNKFIKIGKKMGIWIELITKDDLPSLLEFDALFIRETTAINNHTYRFAQKAESEGLPTLEDTTSIIRCCNKIYLNELMDIHHIEKPKSIVLDKKSLNAVIDTIELPAVIKIPDGSFSHGVYKVTSKEELKQKAFELFDKSEFLLCQEFVPSEYDWRIGILNNKPLFALKYFMAEGHWQIYNHSAKKRLEKEGKAEAVALEDVPEKVLQLAEQVSEFIGDGLYGVDIKQMNDGRILVIEINDNPNIDVGVEDKLLGDELYRRILEHIVNKIKVPYQSELPLIKSPLLRLA